MANDPQKLHDHLCDTYEHITHFLFNQMPANAGIKKHGELAIDALFKEFAQIDTKGVIKALQASDLTRKQKKAALRAINLIKEKRSGVLKGRTCADGRPQRERYSREEVTSPTVSNDSIMAEIVIAAKERRKVASWDVVIVKFEGDSVDIMCQVNPAYEEFVEIERGKGFVFFQLLKALYGCLRSALLWYNLYVSILKGLGFELNPYDQCVANKIINGKQCTIAFYVDDNFASHEDDDVLTDLIKQIERHVGKMTGTRGDEHIILGMKIKCNGDRTVSIGMKSHLE